ncbi:hypothetical protein Ob7_05621 [Thermosipho africanus Ob7]|uniref:DUF2194 domain-containing protein n=1 Tax=Thermosipho africanus TaxID=2421 RepID=UPI000E0A4BB0|nr:DUF2194 domain-containing protein [Thermosipho africanus]RDI91391.1 hypothetical protein Ob7_05621 [Thermosipho africanus Ob7]
MKKVLVIFLMIISVIIFSQKKFLLLYKGSEQYGEYMLKNYVIPYLEKNKINYELLDVERMNFYSINSSDFSTIITWYYSNALENSVLYLRQLSIFIENGGNFFFFNNIGANADARELNNVFNKIGVHYKYGYKQLSNYNIEYDKNFFKTSPSTDISRPVEEYEVFSKETKIILSFKVNDKKYPMIFLSNNGGGAIFNSFIDKEGNIILDIQKILHYLTNKKVGRENKILVVCDKYDKEFYLEKQFQLKKLLEYAKINFETDYVERFFEYSYIDLTPFRYIIWITDSKFIHTNTIKRFINNGGTLLFITDPYNTPWNKNIVLEKNNIEKILFNKELFFLSNTDEGCEFDINFDIDFNIELDASNIVLANLVGSKPIPAIWYKKEGSGYIGYIYPPLIKKETRGLILQSILEMQDFNISGFLNSFIFYLDDFPIPSYNVTKRDVIDTDFYYKTWWKDIKAFAKSYNIKYTIVTPLSYNGVSNPPFEFSEYLITHFPKDALIEIDNSDFELGLHGYNHLSLTKENWPNPQNIIESLRAAKKFLESILGHKIFLNSYVAPNNIIDEYGVQNLIKALPEVTTIGTTYSSTDEFSEYMIYNNNVVIIPRSTYGYYPLKRILISSINTLANFGSFQHFIHPDDFFAKDRNPMQKNWEELITILDRFYYKIKSKMPWLKNYTASEAYPYFLDYLTQKYEYKISENYLEITIPNYSLMPKYFLLKTKIPVEKIIGGKIISFYLENDIYIIQMQGTRMKIFFLR